MNDDLEAIVTRIDDLAHRLVVLDFDGTLSPIVEHPDDAALADGARGAVAALAESDAVVVVLSGRHLDDLAPRLDGLAVDLVGGHGAEARLTDGEHTGIVDLDEIAPVLEEVRGELERLVDGRDGWMIEEKPHSIAVHYRRAPEEEVEELLDPVRDVLRSRTDEQPGWSVLDGKAVVELRPAAINKGAAVRWIADRHPGRAPVVIGDDVTDEEAFVAARELGGDAVLVSDEPRPTAARWRLADPGRVVTALERLADGASAPRVETAPEVGVEHPIESYGMITDSRTAALVAPDGSIDWMCVPRFDSPSVFGALLDVRRGGRFRIRPRRHDRLDVQRTYLGESNVLVTRFVDAGDPVLTITDLFVYSRVNAFDPSHTGHILLRRVEAFSRVTVDVEFDARFDYARAPASLVPSEAGIRAQAGTEHLDLRGPGRWAIHDERGGQIGRTTLELEPGHDHWYVLTTTGAERSPHRHLDPPQLLDLTVRTWGRWSRLIEYEGPWRDEVVRSALVLKGLVYEPTGALVAAPTTSLPETVGGVRNWDYRYAWIRDSAYVLECFLRIGHAREAETFIRWLSELTDHIGGAQELRPLYRITGEEQLTEFELPHLGGYRGSAPVRIGNGAATQLQHDIYGAAMQLGYLTVQLGGEVPSARWPVIVSLVETVAERWREPDSGLWEIRAEPRHHTFSKFQCWLAVDRAIRIGRDLGLAAPYLEWEELAREIAEDVMANAWDEEAGTLTQAYGSGDVDASVLLLPLRGFIPPRDRRVRSTVEAVRRELEVTDGLLLRYRTADGLTGHEGAFLMCSFWLVELLARMGDLDEAERLFERLLGLAGPLGLFAEEIDPRTHAHLGNYPQGFTHMGLIGAATALAEERCGRPRIPIP